MDEERITTCGGVCRGSEARVRDLGQRSVEQYADGLLAESRGMQHRCPSLNPQLVQKAWVTARFAWPTGDDHCKREAFQASLQVNQVAQRSAVTPVGVVDSEKQRNRLCEIRRQPEEAMQRLKQPPSPAGMQ